MNRVIVAFAALLLPSIVMAFGNGQIPQPVQTRPDYPPLSTVANAILPGALGSPSTGNLVPSVSGVTSMPVVDLSNLRLIEDMSVQQSTYDNNFLQVPDRNGERN